MIDRTSLACGKRQRLALLATLATVVTGCAWSPPPSGLDLRGATIVAGSAAPALDINGLPGGKAVGAGVGAGTGSGAGVAVGAVGCLAAGPLFPVCLLTVVPTAAAIGAVTGAVVGAAKTEGVDAIALKTSVVKSELASTAYQSLLARQVQKRLQDDFATALPLAAEGEIAGEGAAAPRWLLDVAITEVGTEGKSEFALRLVARLTLRRPGDQTVAYATTKEVQSETELSTAAWVANDAVAMRGVMDVCIRQAANRLLAEMMQPTADASGKKLYPARGKYSTSCDDVPATWTQVASS